MLGKMRRALNGRIGRLVARSGLLLSVSMVVATSAFAQGGDTIQLVPKQVSASVWYVEGESALGSKANKNFISNAAFIVGPQGVVVIDALGSPPLAAALITAIAKITPLKVSHVIVTHYHADHIYGLQEFKKIGAQIIAHPAAKEYLNSDIATRRLADSRAELSPWIDDKTQLLEADTWLDKAADLQLAGITVTVQPLGPAHTPEDLMVYFSAEKVLFSGDLVFKGRIPFIGPTANTGPWLDGLTAMLKLGASAIVPGHGAVSQTTQADLELLRDYLAHLRATMSKAVNDLEPFEAVYAATNWSRFEKLPLFGFANRMNAYNTYLQLTDESLKAPAKPR